MRVTLRDGAFHEDIGYGEALNLKSRSGALDKAKKEATTDGLKRALRCFGNVLGLCLYDKDYTKEVVKIKVRPVSWLVLALTDSRFRSNPMNCGEGQNSMSRCRRQPVPALLDPTLSHPMLTTRCQHLAEVEVEWHHPGPMVTWLLHLSLVPLCGRLRILKWTTLTTLSLMSR